MLRAYAPRCQVIFRRRNATTGFFRPRIRKYEGVILTDGLIHWWTKWKIVIDPKWEAMNRAPVSPPRFADWQADLDRSRTLSDLEKRFLNRFHSHGFAGGMTRRLRQSSGPEWPWSGLLDGAETLDLLGGQAGLIQRLLCGGGILFPPRLVNRGSRGQA